MDNRSVVNELVQKIPAKFFKTIFLHVIKVLVSTQFYFMILVIESQARLCRTSVDLHWNFSRCFPVSLHKIGIEVLRVGELYKLYKLYKRVAESSGEQKKTVVFKKADRQASRFLKMRSSKPKMFGVPVGALGARRGFASITGPRFSDYFPQRMRGMAMDSRLLRPVPTRFLKIDVFCFSGALEYIMHYNTTSSIEYND